MPAYLMDQPLLALLTMRESLRRARRAVGAAPFIRLDLTRLVGERLHATHLVAVPPALGRGDASVAEAIYGGRFRFCGQTLAVAERPVFALKCPSVAFAAELNGFAWLVHHQAAGDALAAENARMLVGDWIAVSGNRLYGRGFEPAVVARRVISWLAAADFLLDGADRGFAERFLKSLSAQARMLRLLAEGTPDGEARLCVRIALAFVSLCLPAAKGRIRITADNLSRELDRQVLPDGGHISRDPSVLVTLAGELVSLRETYRISGQALPKGLYPALDRMLPALRFFRHGDGQLALFNGAGATRTRDLDALLAFDETLGNPIVNARHSGYHRLAAGQTMLIADTGAPPPSAVAGRAHAGTLAFELSCGLDRLVVNCGRPGEENADWRRLSRSTAAHSTVTLNDRSSSRFARSAGLDRFLGTPLVPGPSAVPSIDPTEEGLGFDACHDGYQRAFGLIHRRAVTLSRDGMRVEGRDRFDPAADRRLKPGGPVEATARFHLHPAVVVERAGSAIRLKLRGQSWLFSATSRFEIEDSVFFADAAGARRTLQLVARFDAEDADGVAWQFERER